MAQNFDPTCLCACISTLANDTKQSFIAALDTIVGVLTITKNLILLNVGEDGANLIKRKGLEVIIQILEEGVAPVRAVYQMMTGILSSCNDCDTVNTLTKNMKKWYKDQTSKLDEYVFRLQQMEAEASIRQRKLDELDRAIQFFTNVREAVENCEPIKQQTT